MFCNYKEKFDEENVIIEENDPKEIKEATREMYKRVREEFWDEWNETKVKQKVFGTNSHMKENYMVTLLQTLGKIFY